MTQIRSRIPLPSPSRILPGLLTLGLVCSAWGIGAAGLAATAGAAGQAMAGDPASDGSMRYRLAPGDRLKVSVFRMEGYETVAEVLSDGTLNLPRLGSVPVWGLSRDQARQRITSGYGRILRRPLVYLDLVEARPVRVSISGEVQRPGLYSIGRGGTNQLSSSGGGTPGTSIPTSGWPTLLDALQRAGGLTAYGDLRRLTIQRPSGPPGAPIRTLQFDFWKSLQGGGGPVTNPLLYDGDSITIPRSENLTQTELLAVASSTFAPDTISVNVVGEVERPGPQSIKANSPLSQALLSAGGLTRRASASNVRLLRLESNGTIRQASISYDPASPMGSNSNPPLQQGDVVVVDRHGWAKANDNLKSVVEPISPLINAGSLFRLLGL
ncbi:MAG: SLBB domain-containing protein [Cyanobacteriota bacterium]